MNANVGRVLLPTFKTEFDRVSKKVESVDKKEVLGSVQRERLISLQVVGGTGLYGVLRGGSWRDID